MSLEEDLDQTLLDNYRQAGRAAGYWGNYFNRELVQKGGLTTVKRLLRPSRSDKVAPGLQALIDVGRTDLSVEATVLEPRFRVLFTDTELAEARRRLESLPGHAARRPVPPESNFPDEIDGVEEFIEGAVRRVTINAYERDPDARAACIAKYGLRCAACGISFEERYGPIGRDFIHVHHKKPLAARRGEYKLRPTVDLAPVCPNCHAMLHTQNPPLSIDELRTIMRQQSGKRRLRRTNR
jgi:5-methylcytosine-specific restriction protein A